MNIQIELDAIATAKQPLQQLEATLESELEAALRVRPTPITRNRPYDIQTTLRQLREGLGFNEGTEPRLWAVLNSEPMQRFRFRAPGLAPLDRLEAKLRAEQEAANNPPVATPLFQFRYTGKPWQKVAGARRNTGDTVQLTRDVAARWAHVLEPVSETALRVMEDGMQAAEPEPAA